MKSATSHPRVVVIDVGNSSTSLGFYSGGRIRKAIREKTAELSFRRAGTLLRELTDGAVVDGAALASVSPSVNAVLVKAIKSVCKTPTLRVRHTLELGAPISYPEPEAMGEDRLANLAGGVARYSAPVIIVDIGTATTFDIIQPRKGYAGGVIAPGPALMLEYLAERAALLPRIDLTPVRQMIGKCTEQAMRIGALHGYQGMVKEITHLLIKEMKNRHITLCATGGYARWVLKGMDLPFIYDQHLTLYGIARIYELNT